MITPLVMFFIFLLAIPQTTCATKKNWQQLKGELTTEKEKNAQLQETLQKTTEQLQNKNTILTQQIQTLTEKNDVLQNIVQNVDKHIQQAQHYEQAAKKKLANTKKQQNRIVKRQAQKREKQLEYLQEKKHELKEKEALLKTKELTLEETFANIEVFSKQAMQEEKAERENLRREIAHKNKIIQKTTSTLHKNTEYLNNTNKNLTTLHHVLQTTEPIFQETNIALELTKQSLMKQEQQYANLCAFKDQILECTMLEKDMEMCTLKKTVLTNEIQSLIAERDSLTTACNTLQTVPCEQIACVCAPLLQSDTWWYVKNPLSAGTFAVLAHIYLYSFKDTQSIARSIARTVRDSFLATGLCSILTSNYTKYNGITYAGMFALLDVSSRALHDYYTQVKNNAQKPMNGASAQETSTPEVQQTIADTETLSTLSDEELLQEAEKSPYACTIRAIGAWLLKVIVTHGILKHTLFKN